MKAGIHPDHGTAVLRNPAAGTAFLTRSTLRPTETIEWEDGHTYPVHRVDVSAASHPFWTGHRRVVDTEGPVEKFWRPYGR